VILSESSPLFFPVDPVNPVQDFSFFICVHPRPSAVSKFLICAYYVPSVVNRFF
jgi:hypothetical protein